MADSDLAQMTIIKLGIRELVHFSSFFKRLTTSPKTLNCTSTELTCHPATSAFYPLSQDALKAIDAIEYITDHLRQDEEYKMYRDDWKYVAMIIDRLLLYVFFGITVGVVSESALKSKAAFLVVLTTLTVAGTQKKLCVLLPA
ncbi:hypothetical protein ANCDUO_24772 [Ancylostoma duodenale]|uniref:Neurotransmitter-gated ion-channel transmembrane domain-containing protein n=1 Tax=Ancylostoma duodenale TaxID=51022 RepID=A0A0C2FJX6_9BILA|nr:hypothetical protein ANCDUO_24772 [Ancylostoma duodenale]